jgi:hypothetical protein
MLPVSLGHHDPDPAHCRKLMAEYGRPIFEFIFYDQEKNTLFLMVDICYLPDLWLVKPIILAGLGGGRISTGKAVFFPFI